MSIKSNKEELKEYIDQLKEGGELEYYDFYEIIGSIELLLYPMKGINTSFRWMEWQYTDECKELIENDIDINRVNKETLIEYITFIFRKDRFSDGFIYNKIYPSGLLIKLLDRLYKII